MKCKSWAKLGVALAGVLFLTGGCGMLGGAGSIMSIVSMALQFLPLLLGTGGGGIGL
ncbi:MAG: hypothetical protein GXY44_05150 [Phycisphaerales bacterium]|nr:hypothetical protein [Phycisphaerales bacterium]